MILSDFCIQNIFVVYYVLMLSIHKVSRIILHSFIYSLFFTLPIRADVSISIPHGSSEIGCVSSGQCYIPSAVSIEVGETVTWTNNDRVFHTVSSGIPGEALTGAFDSQRILPGRTFEVQFNNVGLFLYFCTIHPWMQGFVYVKPLPASDPLDGFTASLESLTYVVGDTIKFSGLAVGPSSTHGAVTYIIEGADGNLAGIGQLEPNPDLIFQGEFITGGPLWESEGTYTIVFNQASSTKSIPFHFSQTQINVSLELPTYENGDIVRFTGSVSLTRSLNIPITYRVVAPNRNLVGIGQINLNSNRSFQGEFVAGGPLWKNEGLYTLIVHHGNVNTERTFLFLLKPLPQKGPFVAYNDFSWSEGQLAKNITRITTDNTPDESPEGNEGAMIDYNTGEETQVTLHVTGGRWLKSRHPTFGQLSSSGTDGFNVFDGKVDATGVLSYSTNSVHLTFSNLDPTLLYQVVLFGNRNKEAYASKFSKIEIVSAVRYQNKSTPGSLFLGPGDESVTIVNGYNTENGYVARFSDISPGTDAWFKLVISDGGSPIPPQFYLNTLVLRATTPETKDSITQIGFSNDPDGDQDVTFFLKDEVFHISLGDVDLDPFLEPTAFVEVTLNQPDVSIRKRLRFDQDTALFSTEIDLSHFSEGEVEVDVTGYILRGDKGDSPFPMLTRRSFLFILPDSDEVTP